MDLEEDAGGGQGQKAAAEEDAGAAGGCALRIALEGEAPNKEELEKGPPYTSPGLATGFDPLYPVPWEAVPPEAKAERCHPIWLCMQNPDLLVSELAGPERRGASPFYRPALSYFQNQVNSSQRKKIMGQSP